MNNTLPAESKASDSETAAAATAVIITYSANAERHVIGQIIVSYNPAPAPGRLTIEDGSGVIVFDVDILVSGVTNIPFHPPIAGTPNTAMIVTLASGGGTSVGKLNVRHWLQSNTEYL